MKSGVIVLAAILTATAHAAEAPLATQGPIEPYSGSSLLKATLSARPDPQQARLEAVSYFAVPAPEPRTMKKHDLVTIIIREESEFTSEGNTELNKEYDFNAAIEELVKLNLDQLQINPGGVGDVPLTVRLNGTREFTGEGAVDRSDSLTARITAEVLDVKPNGTLVLQARGYIKTDEEESEIILSGICRAEDVNIDNTILSSQLYDKRVEKKHKGAVRDSTKRGWVPRLLDWINPF